MSQGSASWPLVVSVALIAGGAGYLLSPRSPALAPETMAADGATEGSEKQGVASPALAQLDELSTENKNLKRQIGELVTKLEKTAEAARVHEEALKTARADLAAARQAPPAAPPVEKPKILPAPIPSAKWQEALDKVDWAETGNALKEMLPLVAEYASCMKDGKPIPGSAAGIARWNSVLVDAALKLHGAGVPGTGVNGAYTHFAAVVNQMATYLGAAGLPLSKGQVQAFVAIAEDFGQRDERRLAGLEPDSLALERLLSESRLKEGFYAALRQELDPPQRQALVPEELRDRVGVDLFSPALLWATGMKPLKVAGRSEFVRVMKTELARELELRPEDSGSVGAVLEDWGAGLDEAFFAPSDTMEHKGMVRLSRIQISAVAHLELFGRLQASGNLTPQQKDLLRGIGHVWVALKP